MIYFIRAGTAFKIGVAGDPRKRLKQLQIGCPDSLELMGTIPGGARKEAELHKQFAPHRLRGEWFRLTVELEQAMRLLLGGRVPSNVMTCPELEEEGRSWLRGKTMKHVPTGREFVCCGSHWGAPMSSGDNHLFVYTVDRKPEYDPPLTPEEERLGIIPGHKIVVKAPLPGEIVSAFECVLLS